MMEGLLQQSQQQGVDYFLEKKVEIMINMSVNKAMAEITKLNERIAQLEDELSSVKRAVASGARQAPAAAPQAQQQQAYQQPAPAAEAPRQADRPLDRNQVAPSEVQIEKFFYFGGKR